MSYEIFQPHSFASHSHNSTDVIVLALPLGVGQTLRQLSCKALTLASESAKTISLTVISYCVVQESSNLNEITQIDDVVRRNLAS
mmetsp:Transcript_64/g.216  ORF Transcript_64/g.216 Transcript_64/m.216 type:complete len:85 (-) Transcript_64:1445-1699(-)